MKDQCIMLASEETLLWGQETMVSWGGCLETVIWGGGGRTQDRNVSTVAQRSVCISGVSGIPFSDVLFILTLVGQLERESPSPPAQSQACPLGHNRGLLLQPLFLFLSSPFCILSVCFLLCSVCPPLALFFPSCLVLFPYPVPP